MRSTPGKLPIARLLLLLLLLLTTACGPVSAMPIVAPTTQPVVTAVNPEATQTPEPIGATITTTATPTSTLSTSATQDATTTGTPDAQATTTEPTAAATVSAIKSVIQKANEEETEAFASKDPSVMADTATTAYYEQMVQSYNDMAQSGITAVQLLNLEWGDVTLQSPSMVQANTLETWQTTLSDGSTLQETDTNVYALVLQGGSWKVQDDQHPNARTIQTEPAAASSPGTSGAVPAVTPTPEANTGAATPVTSPIPAGTNVDQSTNWSGYMATGGTFTAVSGTWTVPGVSAGSGNSVASDATWVGIGGADTTDLIQAGTMASVQGSQVEYSAWWETLPQSAQTVPLDVAAGDKVSVSITQQQDSTWLIVIRDETSGQQFQKSLAYASSLSSAEWIEEAPAVGRGVIVPLDNFGTVTFTGASTLENGKESTIVQAGGKPVAMYSSTSPSQGRFRSRGQTTQTGQAGQLLAQPSGLAASGASFSVTRSTVSAQIVVP